MYPNENSAVTQALLEQNFTIDHTGGHCLALCFTFLGPTVPWGKDEAPYILVTHIDDPRLPADGEMCTIGYYVEVDEAPRHYANVPSELCLPLVRAWIDALYAEWDKAETPPVHQPPVLPPILRSEPANRRHIEALTKLHTQARGRIAPDTVLVAALEAAIAALREVRP